MILEAVSAVAKPSHDVAVNVCLFCDSSAFLHSLAVMARSITPNRSVKGRVTQTLKIKSKARVNLEDTTVTFTWKIGDQEYTRRVPAMDGMATDEFVIKDLNMAEYHGKALDCYPSNSVGGYNFTRFDISVERFPAPNITKFAFQPDSKDTVDIEWLPVNVTGYPGASVEEYVIELARDKDGSDIEARFNSTGDDVSYVIPLKECSMDYWVRIKAVNGDQDVSEFSDWTAITATGCPLVAVPGMRIHVYILKLVYVRTYVRSVHTYVCIPVRGSVTASTH